MTVLTAVLFAAILGLALGTALGWAATRLEPDEDSLVEAIDALLPQTQCAQCQYPGCRPYAQAIARGKSSTPGCPTRQGPRARG